MKAAAPQAPVSTNTTPKTGAKGRAAPQKSAGAAAFAGLLAKALSAKDAASAAPARGAARLPALGGQGRTARHGGARVKTSGRQRRSDEALGSRADPRRSRHRPQRGRRASARARRGTGRGTADRRRHRRPRAAPSRGSRWRTSAGSLRAPTARMRRAPCRRPQAEKTDGFPAAAKPFIERLAAAEPNGTQPLPRVPPRSSASGDDRGPTSCAPSAWSCVTAAARSASR